MGRKLSLAAVLALLAAAIFLGRPALHIWSALRSEDPPASRPGAGSLDDAGRYSLTEIDSVVTVPDDSLAARLAIQAALRKAALTGRKISVGGARHSMGGHTLYPKALVLDMRSYRRLALDSATGILRAAAGARWADVIAFLDPHGLSVKVMQEYADFTVGGSVSVNCHGWQPDQAPIASTVEALNILDAGGRELRCSRRENRELFSLVLGGYGLFGVILEVELRTVQNVAYARKHIAMPAGLFARNYGETVAGDTEAGFAVGRLSVAKQGFLEQGLLRYWVQVPVAPARLAPADPRAGKLLRGLYQGSARSEYGKGLRWSLEKRLEPLLSPDTISRNQMLSAEAGVLANRSRLTVDVLQEYFIPSAKLSDFIGEMRNVIPNHPRPDLLNVSITSVAEDKDSFLRYAREDLFGVALTFRVAPDADGDEALAMLGRELIDKALELGGTFYLPYRLHATADQLRRAYPIIPAFIALKRKYDPGEMFQNHFYANYANSWEPE